MCVWEREKETYFFLHVFIYLLTWHPLSAYIVLGSGVGDEGEKTEQKQVPGTKQHTA